MATDIKTTAERVNILKSLSKELLNIAKSFEAVQKYHDECTDYISRNENVNSSMASIKTAVEAVAAVLTDLVSTENNAFRFEWRAGMGNIESILVSSSSNNVVFATKGGGSPPSCLINALSAGDFISLQNSLYSTGAYSVHSTAQHAVAYVAGLGGTETLLSRVIKEMD